MVGIRLLTRNGHDWAPRYPLIVEAVNKLKARSCLIDGEAVACDENGLAIFERLRRKHEARAVEPAPLSGTPEQGADTLPPWNASVVQMSSRDRRGV